VPEAQAPTLAENLRDAGFVVDLAYSGNVKRRMRRANRLKARAAVIIGDEEFSANEATLRDLDSGAQERVPLAELAARLKALQG
ncbi:MAG: His/Gly/Thr/Pro-type tRNA ligase C-terminal domain-containing protein, partial [Stellaceae bacterium]